ncbi:MAG: GNAT family N-acetyltransferase [Peptostreptococcus sp.]|uniref:GNAT family N-acetyltransferase n=1 Tax=Peptostreptococcus sp. TaxID=1262 RepID=UPI002FCBDF92
MLELKRVDLSEIDMAIAIIEGAKTHLKEQGVNQWQNGYPNNNSIKEDILNNRGYFIIEEGNILGYVCIDYAGEKAYDDLKGNWSLDKDYVLVHRMAFAGESRGKKLSTEAFQLVENLSKEKNINYFRIDTAVDNLKMRHILEKNNFKYCGVISYDDGERLAYDKSFE